MPPPCSIRLLSKYIARQFIPLIIGMRSKRCRYRAYAVSYTPWTLPKNQGVYHSGVGMTFKTTSETLE